MTRHRRDDEDGLDGDAAWRTSDYGRAARPRGTAGDSPAPRSGPAGAPRPAGGALGTSSGRDDRPGEETRPPWERTPAWDRPGWDEATPAQRRRHDDNAHPSGPLPQVSGAPRRPPSGAWPSGEPDDPGIFRAGGREDASYLRTGFPDPRYAEAGSRHGGDRGADYAERDMPGSGVARGEYPSGGGGAGGSGYPGPDPDHDDTGYHDSYPPRGGYSRDDYEPDYPGEPGYPAGPRYSGGSGYPDEPGYPGEGYRDEGDYPGGDYPGEPGYAPEGYDRDDYPRQSGYPGEAGYPGGPHEGYPDQHDTGYQAADDYPPGHDQAEPPRDRYGLPRQDDPDDHGYGDTGGWYGDEDEDRGRAWGDDEYDSGVLSGFREDTGYPRAAARAPAPSRHRPGHAGPDGRRGGKPKPKRKSAMRRAAGWIALTVLVIVLVVAGAGFYLFWHNYLHPPDYSGAGTGSVRVQITSGETATQVGQQLVNLGVVASVRAFSNAAKASGHGSSLEPGYYLLHKHMSAAQAFALLLKPSSRVQLTVVIPEGMRLSEIITALGKATGNPKGYQQAIKDVSALGLPSYAKGNPEGYLFPATYTVQPGTAPIQVLRAMVQRFKQEAQSVNLPAAAAHGQISERDAIIVASLIQAEGKRPADLPKIARVIYNRLNAKMMLQLDTTVLYARHSRTADVTVAQTRSTKSAYNTYLHVGLPPGPIDSPGAAAIKAALHPMEGHRNWLYFLTVNPKTGMTKFTGSFAVFQTYEQELAAYNASHH
jgi:peptidoglycan lytic transglycosylase G